MRNSSLGMQFCTCKNFWDFADSKSSLNPKNSYKYKSHTTNTRICLESNADSIESSLHDSTQSVESSVPKIVILSVAKNPNLKNPPSLAEGARGWVKNPSLREFASANSWQFVEFANEVKQSSNQNKSTRFAESAHKAQQTIEAIAVEVVEFLDDFGCKARLESAQCPKSSKSTQDAPKSKLQKIHLQKRNIL